MDSSIISIIAALLGTFIIVAAIGPVGIPILQRLKAGQSIREDGPQSHLAKAGTPTMGGIMIVIAVVLVCVILMIINDVSSEMSIMLLTFVLCAAIGFFDDFIKVVKKRNLGLTAKQKLLFQIVIAIIIAIYQSKVSDYGTSIYIPIWGDYLDLGLLYIPFVAFVLVAMVNAVNLTDGLDGLASGCTAITAVFFTIMAMIAGSLSSAIFMASIVGACLGFLIFNHHPAKIFMGDTGSLALGGALAAAAIMMHIELILIIAGGVFVMEVLSVIIQVVSYKTTKKRVFRMAPIHHHFELGGWKETKVVTVFYIADFVLCVIAWALMSIHVG